MLKFKSLCIDCIEHTKADGHRCGQAPHHLRWSHSPSFLEKRFSHRDAKMQHSTQRRQNKDGALGRGQKLAYNRPVPKFLQKYMAPPRLPYDEEEEERKEEERLKERMWREAQAEESKRKEAEEIEAYELMQKRKEEEKRERDDEEREGIHRFRKPATDRLGNKKRATKRKQAEESQEEGGSKAEEHTTPTTKRSKQTELHGMDDKVNQKGAERKRENNREPTVVGGLHNKNQSKLSFAGAEE